MSIQADDIGEMIQLAIAPVFLLSTVCTKLTALINHMSRIVDRARFLMEERLEVSCKEAYLSELAALDIAITLSTACGLLVFLIVVMLFIGGALDTRSDRYIAGTFVFAVVCFIESFCFLLGGFSSRRRLGASNACSNVISL